jgi:hypothetical protein
MATTRKTKLVIWISALALILACVPVLGTPAVATVDPNTIGTFIAQTVNAAINCCVPSPALTPSVSDTPTKRLADVHFHRDLYPLLAHTHCAAHIHECQSRRQWIKLRQLRL